MKKILVILLAICLLAGCAPAEVKTADNLLIAATTAPVAQFTQAITEGAGVTVQCVITEAVSCLHDYTLSVDQMALLEQADAVVISGLGLEDFMEDVLPKNKVIIDASVGVDDVIPGDPHIWLDPDRAEEMAETIADGLCRLMPKNTLLFQKNLEALEQKFERLDDYADTQLRGVLGGGLVTFHDGFRYFADFMDMPLLAAMEVESGSEPAAKDLERIIELVKSRNVPAVFTEVNGDENAARVVSTETGCAVYRLDTAMGGNDYFTAMETNIDAVREAFS